MKCPTFKSLKGAYIYSERDKTVYKILSINKKQTMYQVIDSSRPKLGMPTERIIKDFERGYLKVVPADTVFDVVLEQVITKRKTYRVHAKDMADAKKQILPTKLVNSYTEDETVKFRIPEITSLG